MQGEVSTEQETRVPSQADRRASPAAAGATYSRPCVFGEITLIFSCGTTTPPESGYYAISGIGGFLNAVTVWAKSTNAATAAVRAAEGWREIKTSAGDSMGYRAQCPAGYRALSDVPSPSSDTIALATIAKDNVGCVKEDIGGKKYLVPGERYFQAISLCTKRPEQVIEKNRRTP